MGEQEGIIGRGKGEEDEWQERNGDQRSKERRRR